MKILFLSHRFFPDVGGIEVNTEILARQFVCAGHEVRVVTWSKSSKPDCFSFPVVRAPTVATLFREHCWADVVYENNICLRLSWPAALIGKSSIVALRTWVSRIDGSTGLQDRLKFVWLRRAKGVIAISQRVRERCWPLAKVIGNPYRSELFKIRPDVSRHRDFVFLGRLVSDKGADLAIQALHRLSDQSHRNQDLTLTIIGDGPERAALEDLAAQLAIGEQVQFMGNLRGDALVDCINQHRFLWVPSRWEEPFGNVALEGMACGCIPIVSDGGGLPDAVCDAGLTFKRGDLSDMVEQSLRLLENEDLRQQLASAAADHLKRHVPQKVAERYLEVIEAAVAK